MERRGRLQTAFALIGGGFAIFALPAAWEGPVLLPISDGHAIAVADAVAIAPLVSGTTLLYALIWQERAHVVSGARARPLPALTLAFAGGLGLGLLVASAFSAWFWWWAVGAAIFGTALLTLSVALASSPPSQ